MYTEQVMYTYPSYWGHSTPRTDSSMFAFRVICAQGKRENEGSCQSENHHKNETAPLSQKFDAAKPWEATNMEGDYDSKKYVDIQSEYVVNPTKLVFLEDRVNEYDTKATLMVPTLVGKITISVYVCWKTLDMKGCQPV